MDDILNQVISAIRDLNFEVQKVSFDDMTASGDLESLRSIPSFPECDSSRILKNFPHLFAVHRSATPDRGIFFIVIKEDLRLSSEAQEVYNKYYPEDLLLVGHDPKLQLVAKWLDSKNQPELLNGVLVSRLES